MTKMQAIEGFLNQLNEERDQDYWILLYSLGGTMIGILVFAITVNIYVSYQIVRPLLRLTKIAEIINGAEKRSNTAEEIKKRIDIRSVKCIKYKDKLFLNRRTNKFEDL